MKKVLVLTTVAATLLGSVAFAESHGKGNMGGMGMAGGPRMAQLSFTDLDTNGDGQLTLEELTARPADHFASADTDGDGGLSADEMTAMMLAQIQDRVAAMAAQMITRLDANKDGLVQADEMKPMGNDGAGLERMFAIMDINGDGAVSQEEFDLVSQRLGQMQQRMGQMGQMGERGDNDDHRGMMGGQQGGRGFFGGMFGGRNH
jgi:Ca2+-binding EF-hand superfamily protein